jgi:transcription initiation factor TFIIIB Brf1 subunit/transcription initiation factor TFIIB
MYKCPKCQSYSTSKERSFAGGDTGDRICNSCGYTAQSHMFKIKDSK